MGSKPTELNNEIMKRSKYYFKGIYKGDEFPCHLGDVVDIADDLNEPGYVFRFPDGSEHDNMHDEDWEPLKE